MNVKLKRLLLPLLRAVAKGGPISFRMKSAASQGLFLLGKPKSKGGRLRREQKQAAHKTSTTEIHEAVFRRAGWQCEAIYAAVSGSERCDAGATELDHWLSGSGRRREQQSVENTWALCRYCHGLRTRNQPTAEWWNIIFGNHCARYGYPFFAHITHAQLKRSVP